MDSSNVIDFLPPFTFGLISAVFYLLWHLKIATSWQWSAGFAQTGLGFALVAFPISPTFDIFVAGPLYIGAAYCYGSAILIHFNAPMRRRARRILAAGYFAMHAFLVLILENLKWELFLTDVIFAVMLIIALASVARKSAGPADTAMLISGYLVVIDGLVRIAIFTFVVPTSAELADFAESTYNLVVQFTTTTIGLLFPITGLAAMTTAAIRRHRTASETDPLTGLLNRRGFEGRIQDLGSIDGQPGTIIVCDIDHFKKVNDGFGHAAGDAVIVELAEMLRRHLGPTSIIARFGGEEFVALLPGGTTTDAALSAQVVRMRFAGSDWRHIGIDRQITASFGIAPCKCGASVDTAIQSADEALYAAKGAGRNQVVVADDSDLPPLSAIAGCKSEHHLPGVAGLPDASAA